MKSYLNNHIRIGTKKETQNFVSKYKEFFFVKDIIENFLERNILFDSFLSDMINEFDVSFTFTGFGPYIYIPNRILMYEIMDNVFDEKQAVTNFDWLSHRTEKYHDNPLNKHYNSIAFLPNFNNLQNINFSKLSKFIFEYDGYIKLHPLTHLDVSDFLYNKFDGRIIEKEHSGISLLENTNNVGITSASELMIVAPLMKKNVLLLDNDDTYFYNDSRSSFISFYKVLLSGKNIFYYLNTMKSGIIPWSLCDEKTIIDLLNFYKNFYKNYFNL